MNHDDCDDEEVNHSLSIVECLELQLQEIELLQSMFANPGEFNMFDDSMVENAKIYIGDEKTRYNPPSHLDFTINLTVEDSLKLSICIHLPHLYPCIEPEVFVRSDQMNRKQETNFNVELNKMIQSLERNSVCLYTAVNWIQENVQNFYSEEKLPEQEASTPKDVKKYESFTRYWIYSHHIYSKIKRKTMLDLSSDLNITGFMLPGKPGIICIEGTSFDCEDWWYRIRNMTWKRILCKKVEQYNVEGLDSTNVVDVFDTYRRFEDFKEISFYNSKSSMKQDYHMDMGEFYRFLVEKKCAYMFKEYFGFEGKS